MYDSLAMRYVSLAMTYNSLAMMQDGLAIMYDAGPTSSLNGFKNKANRITIPEQLRQ